jgi:C-terminal processing protease CtpA/Prc
MVGRMKNNKITVGGIGTASEWKTLIDNKNVNPGAIVPGGNGAANIKTSVPALNKFDLTLNEDGFGPSDHSSFYGKRIPVLFFFTGSHEDYHKPTDTAEKINYADLDNITWFVADIARTIDQNPVRPAYTVAKSSGTMGGRGFTVSLGTVPSYSESTDGMTLDGVRDNSPAAKAGLKPGDKIVKLAGKEVRNVMDYTYILGTMKAGEEYEVEIMRGTERLTLKIIPAAATRR